MTRKRLMCATGFVIGLYGLAIVIGIAIRVRFPGEHNQVYDTYKDFIPLFIALPAAYFAYAIQSRSAYLTALRAAWSKLADAVGGAITYTEVPGPTRQEHLEILRKLSAVIEELRGLYRNLPAEGAPDGWYPFEPIKQIYDQLKQLGYGDDATIELQKATRDNIYQMWKGCRAQFLSELNIDVPTYHHAEFAEVMEPGE